MTPNEADEAVQRVGDRVRSGELSEEAGRQEVAAIFAGSSIPGTLKSLFRNCAGQDGVDLAQSGNELVINKLLTSETFYQFDLADQQSFTGWVHRLVKSGKSTIIRNHLVATRATPGSSFQTDESDSDILDNDQSQMCMVQVSQPLEDTVIDEMCPASTGNLLDDDEAILRRFRSREERVYILALELHREHRLPPLVRPMDPRDRADLNEAVKASPRLAADSLMAFRNIIDGADIGADISDAALALWDEYSYADITRALDKLGTAQIAVLVEAATMTLLHPNRTGLSTMRKLMRSAVSSRKLQPSWRQVTSELLDAFLAHECEITSRHSSQWSQMSGDPEIIEDQYRRSLLWPQKCDDAINFPHSPLGGDIDEVWSSMVEIWEAAYHSTSLGQEPT